MDSLIKQTRVRFSGNNKEESSSSTRDKQIPPQKTQSFRERKRSQSWIKRQFSRQMSSDYDTGGADYSTAVAAAAYAILSLEESKRRDKRETTYGHDKPLNKTKSKVEDTTYNHDKPLNKPKSKVEDVIGVPSAPLKSALKISDETSKTSSRERDVKVPIKMPEKGVSSAPSIKKRLSFAEPDENTVNKPEKPVEPVKRPPSPADKQLNITDSNKPQVTLPKPYRPPTPIPTATKPGPQDSQADAWQKEEMASINERYDKLRSTIEDWELKKKKKAKRKIERIEAELDKKRAKDMQSYRTEIARIEGIAGGAKAQAEENRRKEELKAKEKANKIRLTGKMPATFLCF